MDNVDVTVGIVTYNDDKNLAQLLEELRRQSIAAPVVVIDGANQEETKTLCRSFNTTYLESIENDIGENRKQLVEKCLTKFIAFIDSDCLPETGDWLEQLLQKASTLRTEQPMVAGVGGGQILHDAGETRPSILNLFSKGLFSLGSPQFTSVQLKSVDHLPTYNAIFDVDTLKSCGNFSSTPFNVGEDLLLGWNLKKENFLMYKLDEPKVRHLVEGSWIKKMYGYGRAQSFAARRARFTLPFRFFLSALFLPLVLCLCVFVPFILLALVALFQLIAPFFLKGTYPIVQKIKFPFVILSSYLSYSLGMWREMIIGQRNQKS